MYKKLVAVVTNQEFTAKKKKKYRKTKPNKAYNAVTDKTIAITLEYNLTLKDILYHFFDSCVIKLFLTNLRRKDIIVCKCFICITYNYLWFTIDNI